jgi:hypothetical protein
VQPDDSDDATGGNFIRQATGCDRIAFHNRQLLLDQIRSRENPQKSRASFQAHNCTAADERDGYLDGFWSLGQGILWFATGDRQYVAVASQQPKENNGRAWAASLIEELPSEVLKKAADKLRDQCLSGDVRAYSGGRKIRKKAWLDLEIAFEEGVPFVRRRNDWGLVPIWQDVWFRPPTVLRTSPGAPSVPADGASVDEDGNIQRSPYRLSEEPPNGSQQKLAWVVAKDRWQGLEVPREAITTIHKRINEHLLVMLRKGALPVNLRSEVRPTGSTGKDRRFAIHRDAVRCILGLKGKGK